MRLISVIRKLDGYTQSSLIQGDDGRLYVAKLYPNPRSPNSLANEVIGSNLLSYLSIPTPSWRILLISRADIAKFPQLSFITIDGRREPEPGLHFASEYLADPDHTIVDCIERPITAAPILNISKFLDIYLFDLWANHRDYRQYVYRRHRQSGLGKAFFIDNSHLFGNESWAEQDGEEHPDSNTWIKPLTYAYDLRVSRRVQEFRRRIPEILHHAMVATPPEWHGSDIRKLEAWLLQRLECLRELVEQNLVFHGVVTGG